MCLSRSSKIQWRTGHGAFRPPSFWGVRDVFIKVELDTLAFLGLTLLCETCSTGVNRERQRDRQTDRQCSGQKAGAQASVLKGNPLWVTGGPLWGTKITHILFLLLLQPTPSTSVGSPLCRYIYKMLQSA